MSNTDKHGICADLPKRWTKGVKSEYNRRLYWIQQGKTPPPKRKGMKRAGDSKQDRLGIVSQIPEHLRGTPEGKRLYHQLWYKQNRIQILENQKEYYRKITESQRRQKYTDAERKRQRIAEARAKMKPLRDNYMTARKLQELSGGKLLTALDDILHLRRGFTGVGK